MRVGGGVGMMPAPEGPANLDDQPGRRVGGQVDAAVALAAGDVVISRADYIALCARMLSDAIVAASA